MCRGFVLANYERIRMSTSISEFQAHLEFVFDVFAKYSDCRKNLKKVELLHSSQIVSALGSPPLGISLCSFCIKTCEM